jgi:hypothetical protein
VWAMRAARLLGVCNDRDSHCTQLPYHPHCKALGHALDYLAEFCSAEAAFLAAVGGAARHALPTNVPGKQPSSRFQLDAVKVARSNKLNSVQIGLGPSPCVTPSGLA